MTPQRLSRPHAEVSSEYCGVMLMFAPRNYETSCTSQTFTTFIGQFCILFTGMFTKKKPLEIKKQTITVPAKTGPSNSSLFARKHNSSRSTPVSGSSRAQFASSSSAKLNPRFSPKTDPNSADHRPSPSTPQSSKRKRATADAAPDFGTDGESENDDEDAERARESDAKRRKQREVRALYKNRRVRSLAAFEPTNGECVKLPIIHAAEIPSKDRGTRYEPYFASLEEGWTIELQYPSLCERERYGYCFGSVDRADGA